MMWSNRTGVVCMEAPNRQGIQFHCCNRFHWRNRLHLYSEPWSCWEEHCDKKEQACHRRKAAVLAAHLSWGVLSAFHTLPLLLQEQWRRLWIERAAVTRFLPSILCLVCLSLSKIGSACSQSMKGGFVLLVYVHKGWRIWEILKFNRKTSDLAIESTGTKWLPC